MDTHCATKFLKTNSRAAKFKARFQNWAFAQEDQPGANSVQVPSFDRKLIINNDNVSRLSQECLRRIKQRYSKKRASYGSDENIFFCLARLLNVCGSDFPLGIDLELISLRLDNPDIDLDTAADLLNVSRERLLPFQTLLTMEQVQLPVLTEEELLERSKTVDLDTIMAQCTSDTDDDSTDLLTVLAHGEPLPIKIAKQLLR